MRDDGKNELIPYSSEFGITRPSNAGKTAPIKEYLDFSMRYNLKDKYSQTNILNQNGLDHWGTILEAWFMYELANNPVQVLSFLGVPLPNGYQVKWFGNQVLYGIGGEKSDILILLQDDSGNRAKAILLEIRKDNISNKVFEQIKKYSYRVVQLVTANVRYRTCNPFEIIPIVVGGRASNSIKIPPPTYEFTISYGEPLTVKVHQPIVKTYKADEKGIHL